tara:strand:- start:5 stop:292 length:288 start_codon:yes stop_codon:yes gene_type:complete
VVVAVALEVPVEMEVLLQQELVEMVQVLLLYLVQHYLEAEVVAHNLDLEDLVDQVVEETELVVVQMVQMEVLILVVAAVVLDGNVQQLVLVDQES